MNRFTPLLILTFARVAWPVVIPIDREPGRIELLPERSGVARHKTPDSHHTSKSHPEDQTAALSAPRTVRVGRIAQGEYPIAPAIVVDYTDDIGTRGRKAGRWTGPIPGPQSIRSSEPRGFSPRDFRNEIAVAGGGGCSFHIECDDGNPCTTDSCNITEGMPAGSGACIHSPVDDGQPGDCDDGVFCNGGVTCQTGACVSAGSPCVGDEVCSEDLDFCQNGPCSSAANCTDNNVCTAEICNAGICDRGMPPCGIGGDCDLRRCVGCGPGCSACQTNLDCSGGTCVSTNPPISGCFDGRCCDGFTCSKATKSNCTVDWYPGDTGRLTSQDACPVCPRYEAGIGDDPFTAIVGPASLSPANNRMSGTPIYKLGEDYNFCATTPEGYLTLTSLRFVGGVSSASNSRVAFEFYDINGQFIEDIDYAAEVNDLSVQPVEFQPPLVIPCQGFIVAHVLQNLAYDVNAPGEFLWVATNGTINPGDAVDEGMNNKGTLYVDTDLDWSESSPPQPVPNFIKVCAGGLQDGIPCGSNADCDSDNCLARSSDVLAFELEGIPTSEPRGACCYEDVVPTCDEMTEWDCDAANGTFLGLGTTCAFCSGGSNPDVPCRTCTGGDNASQPCGAPADCPGGSCDMDNTLCLDGGTCVSNIVCADGACCVTLTGECQTGHTPSTCATVGGEFQGFGTDCDPNCCEHPLSNYSGADNCEGVVVHDIEVPAVGEIVVTITGNNQAASNTPEAPDSCDTSPYTAPQELGWWEAFQIDDCAMVRIDFCCTNPVKLPAYRILFDSCPCGTPILPRRDQYIPDEPEDAPGSPYCDDPNSWFKFGPLSSGSYYYPILSYIGAQFGQYQLHITVKPCPKAACCYTACTNSSNTTGCQTDDNCPASEDCIINDTDTGNICRKLCELNTDCGQVATCDPRCGIMDSLDCEDVDGAYLGPPDRFIPQTTCGNVCDRGSCCTGPGQCVENFTEEDCENLFPGTYRGGSCCTPAVCVGGSRDGLCCFSDANCPGGTCEGDSSDPVQTACPVCEIAGQDNCQPFDDSFSTRLSDLTIVGGVRAADDFRPIGSSISKVCVWGTYTAPDPTNPAITEDCADEVTDNFIVSVYNPNSVGLPTGGVPLAERSVTGANVASAHQFPTSIEDILQYRVFAFQLTFDSPITGLTPGNLYWLEVRNDTNIPANNNCYWSWLNVDTLTNDYSATGGGVQSAYYVPGSARWGDMAYCLDVDFLPGPVVNRACCDCEETCTLETKRDCDTLQSSWDVTSPACNGCPMLPPANDNCADVVNGPATPDGVFGWNNHCTSTDGPNPTPSGSSLDETMTNDIWFKFVSAGNCVTFSTCPTGTADGGGIDTMIAAYRDPNNPTICSCPTQANHIARLFPAGVAYDENCTGILAGAGAFVFGFAEIGDCFLIRVGGFGGQGGESGIGIMVAESLFCDGGDPASVGDNLCAGGTNNGQPCSTGADCPGGACGMKSRYLSITPALPAVAGGTTSIQVEIVTAKQCAGGVKAGRGCESNSHCPGGTCENSPNVGDVWWAGPEVSIPNSPQAALRGSLLQCSATPANAQVWTTGVLHLYGPPIVPFATYNVRMCTADGNFCSDPLLVSTGEWGDIAAPFGGVSQPAFGDVNEIIFKFRNLGSSQPMTRVDLIGVGNSGNPNTPNQSANFADISAGVDAFRGFGFPYAVPACP